jgi:hypothetical protein
MGPNTIHDPRPRDHHHKFFTHKIVEGERHYQAMNTPAKTNRAITTLPPPRRSVRQATSTIGTRRSARALKKRHHGGGQIYGQDYGILPSDWSLVRASAIPDRWVCAFICNSCGEFMSLLRLLLCSICSRRRVTFHLTQYNVVVVVIVKIWCGPVQCFERLLLLQSFDVQSDWWLFNIRCFNAFVGWSDIDAKSIVHFVSYIPCHSGSGYIWMNSKTCEPSHCMPTSEYAQFCSISLCFC